jgi:hypothetical protein
MKKKLNIINVGKIMIDGKFTYAKDEDHTIICVYEDGMEFPKFTLTIPGLKALYMEIGDHLRDFEALRNPR